MGCRYSFTLEGCRQFRPLFDSSVVMKWLFRVWVKWLAINCLLWNVLCKFKIHRRKSWEEMEIHYCAAVEFSDIWTRAHIYLHFLPIVQHTYRIFTYLNLIRRDYKMEEKKWSLHQCGSRTEDVRKDTGAINFPFSSTCALRDPLSICCLLGQRVN